MWKAWGVAAALAATAGTAAAQSYDLHCAGTEQDSIDGPATPYEYGFRVDLGTGRWCWDHCERTFEIHEVAPERLVLADEDTREPRGRYYLLNEINRQTGRHELVSISTMLPGRYRKVEGQCERRPFSGFPEPKF